MPDLFSLVRSSVEILFHGHLELLSPLEGSWEMAVGEADLLPVSCNGGLGYLNQSSCWKKKMESAAENVFENDLKSIK